MEEGQKEDFAPCAEIEADNFQRVDLFLAFVLRVALHCFSVASK